MFWAWHCKINFQKPHVWLNLDLVFIYLCYGGTWKQFFLNIIVKNTVNTVKKQMPCSFTKNFRVQTWPNCYCSFPAGAIPVCSGKFVLLLLAGFGTEKIHLTEVKLEEMLFKPPCIVCMVQTELLLTLQYAGTVQKVPVCHDSRKSKTQKAICSWTFKVTQKVSDTIWKTLWKFSWLKLGLGFLGRIFLVSFLFCFVFFF